MADTELSSKLYEKASAEQDKFRAWLMDQPPADILNHAVEYAVREDILMEIGALELPDDQARALLASPDTMADIYKTFSKMVDTGHMDVVRESIEDRAATLSMEQAVQEAVQMEMESQGKLEAVYLVDRSSLLHLKEVQGGDFAYTVFDMLTVCQERRAQKSALVLTRRERITACVAELQRLQQEQERYKQEKLRAYENFSGGTLSKDAYLKQRAEIDGKLSTVKSEQDNQEQLLTDLERMAFQDSAREDDVFTPYAGATELTAELAGTFIKEVLVSSPTEIEIVWKFRDVFDMQSEDK